MEQSRQLRFLIPPFVLLTSLLWGAVVDPHIALLYLLEKVTTKSEIAQIVGVAVTGGIAVIALGFLISAISIFFLRVGFCFFHRNYEAQVSPDTLERVGRAVGAKRNPDGCQVLYAVATYDHWKLPHSLHEWIARRWDVFMLSINSCGALILSHLVGLQLQITQGWRWWFPNLLLFTFLVINGLMAWRQTMGMLSFLSSCSLDRSTEEEVGTDKQIESGTVSRSPS